MKKATKYGAIGYNPYFIGNHSATRFTGEEGGIDNMLQSLFYWKSFCNSKGNFKRA